MTSAPVAAETPFAKAMSRVSPDALGEEPYIEFGQTSELFALSKSDQRWMSMQPVGSQLVVDQSAADVLGINAQGADFSIEVGISPERVGLIAGGQDPDAINDAATQAGYEGEQVLTQPINPAVPATIRAQQIKPLEEDVVVATIDADVGWVDGGSMFADERVGPVAVCLGDVLAATIAEIDGEVVGVGVRADGATILSVICLPGGEGAVSDVEDDLAAPELADRFEVVDSAVTGDLAKVTAEHGGDTPAGLLIASLAQRQLPGT